MMQNAGNRKFLPVELKLCNALGTATSPVGNCYNNIRLGDSRDFKLKLNSVARVEALAYVCTYDDPASSTVTWVPLNTAGTQINCDYTCAQQGLEAVKPGTYEIAICLAYISSKPYIGAGLAGKLLPLARHP